MRWAEHGASSGNKDRKGGKQEIRKQTPHYKKLEVSSCYGCARPEGGEDLEGP